MIGAGLLIGPLPRGGAAGSTFVVGRDVDGHWLAVETHGFGGGFFASRDAAIHYARDETGRRAGAVLLAEAPISLTPR